MAEIESKPVVEAPLDEAEEARLDALAEAELDAGEGVPHEQVRTWLMRLIQGEKVPPPSA